MAQAFQILSGSVSKIITIAIFLNALSIQFTLAGTTMGADISYSYAHGTKYFITAYSYRNCAGAPLYITLYASDGTKSISFGNKRCCGIDITPVCANSCTLCTDLSCNFGYGVQRWTIYDSLDVSNFSNCQLTIWFNDAVADRTTDMASYGDNIYVECKLNRCTIDHNSPRFQFYPKPFFCQNVLNNDYVTVIPGTGNDSIVYKLIPPVEKPGKSMIYDSGFSYNAPMTFSDYPKYYSSGPKGFHYDGKTGSFYFKPVKTESSFVGFEADEYLKDNSGNYYLAGTTTRVMEMVVLACNSNHLPIILSDNIPKTDTVYTCSGIPVNFSVYTQDSDVNDNVKLTTSSDAGAKITVSNSSRSSAAFNWTPVPKDVRKIPYSVTFTSMDNKCPLYGQSQRNVYIVVKDSLPVTGINVVDSGCGKYHISLSPVFDKNYKLSYTWFYDSVKISGLPEFSYRNTLAGKHNLTVIITNASGCSETFTKVIAYDTLNRKLSADTGICKGASISLIAAKGINLVWSPSKGLSDSTIYNPVAKPDSTTTYTVSAVDSMGCPFSDKTEITVSDVKLKISPPQTVCSYSSLPLYTNHTPSAIYNWTPSSYIFKKSGDSVWTFPGKTTTYHVSANLKGCIKEDSVKITVWPKLTINQDLDACLNDSVFLHVPKGKSYKWFDLIHNRLISTDSFFHLKAVNLINGNHYLVVVENPLSGCMDSGTINIAVHNFNPQLSEYSAAVCKGSTVSITASGGDQYSWNIPGYGTFSGSSVKFDPSASLNISVNILYSNFGCSRNFIIPVYVAPTAKRYPADTLCQGDFVRLHESGGIAYYWQPLKGLSSITAASPLASPPVTTTYTVLVTDSASKCYRLDTFTVAVDSDCVWPGDPNKDKICNYLDVLNIGLAYGATGPKRRSGNTAWKNYPDTSWNKILPNGINYKHIDCNGDGVIDFRDTVIINRNYGLSHNKWTPGTGNPNDPPLYFKFSSDTFYSGDTASAYLYAGSALKPLKDGYGIAVQENYYGNPSVSHTSVLSAFCDYFCTGNELNYVHPVILFDQYDATFTETNHKGSSGSSGKIAVLTFRLKDSLSYLYPKAGEKVYAHLISGMAIDSTGKELPVFGLDDSAVVMKARPKKIVPGIEKDLQWAYDVKIYPNPAKDALTVETGAVVLSKLVLYNALGKSVLSYLPKMQINNFDLTGIAPGLYCLELESAQGRYTQKIIIRR
jgi:hypothetical protein